MMRALAVAAVVALAPAAAAAAPRIAVLTMTPGPGIAERFGHAAIRVDDRVYNYGTFDGGDPQLIRKFLSRELVYWLSVVPYREFVARYDNRETMTVQELALDEDEAVRLAAFLADNARPDKREYQYDFFVDNCATRVRDAVDRAVGGALSSSGRAQPSPLTYRGWVRRVLGPTPPLAFATSLVLNAYVDEPITRWEAAFLPSELAALLRDARRSDGRPLVGRERHVAGRRVDPPETLLRAPTWLAIALFALVLLAAAVDGGKRRGTRIAAGAGLALAALLGGALGCGLVVTSTTPYVCARWNANLLELSPLALALVPLAVGLAAGRVGPRRLRALRALLAATLALALADFGTHLFGVARQRHLDVAAVVALLAALSLAATRAVATPARSASAAR